NSYAVAYPDEQTLHELVLRASSRAPDAIAIDDAAGPVSYAALVERAHEIAEILDAAGLRPNEAVAVMFPRGTDCVAAMLGVLIGGGVYVPIALEEPEARRNRLLDLLGVRLFLCGEQSGGVELVTRDA